MKKVAFITSAILLIACSDQKDNAVANTNNDKASKNHEGIAVKGTVKQVDWTIKYPRNTEETKTMKTIYDYKVKDINGNDFDFAKLKGKKILIVNTASECGYTPQYEQMEALYKEYGGDKFVIIGFPANDFGAQEPGTNEEIAGFCKKNYGVTFPMMSKVTVLGENKADIYKFLTEKSLNGKEDVEIKWNFFKILVDENGNYVKTLNSKVLPNDPEVVNWIKG